MEINRWWQELEGETYWLELTDREDLGVDLRAPLLDEAGKPNWRYTLFQEVQPGDTVFHYQKRSGGIVAVSTVAGVPAEHPIVWGARGSYAREKGTTPHTRPGYRVPIRDFRTLPKMVSARDIEAVKPALRQLSRALADKHGSIYFPFELSEKRPTRPLQGYAFKLPSAFMSYFPQLLDYAEIYPTADPVVYEKRARAISARWKARGRPRTQPAGQEKPQRTPVGTGYQFARDPNVKAWVAAEANGRCESCGHVPFLDACGEPFLELHHVEWLSQGGADTVANAVALCPNCHRACHLARDREELAARLYERIHRLRRKV